MAPPMLLFRTHPFNKTFHSPAMRAPALFLTVWRARPGPALAAVALAAIPLLASWVADHPTLSTRVGQGLVGFILLVLLPWQAGLIMGSLLIVLEGALRKWAFPEMQIEMYALKYVVFSAAYLRFFLEWMTGQRTIHVPRMLLAPLLLFAGWVIVQTFNPRLPDFTVGLIGAFQYLFFIPLFVMMPEWCKTERHWIRFYLFQVLLSLVPLTVAVVQFFSPSDHVININPWGGACMGSHAAVGEIGHCRLSGTFTFVSRFVVYLTVAWGMALTLRVLGKHLSKVSRSLLDIYLAILALVLWISQARSAVAMAVAIWLGMAWLDALIAGRPLRTFARPIALSLGVAAILLAYLPASTPVLRSTIKRFMYDRGGEFSNRFLSPLAEPFKAFLLPEGGLLGSGAGSRGYVAGRVATEYKPSELSTVLGAERPHSENVAVELGIPGMILFYLFKFFTLATFFKVLQGGVGATQARLMFLPLAFHLAFVVFPLEQVYYEVAYYLWSMTGVLIWAMESHANRLPRR